MMRSRSRLTDILERLKSDIDRLEKRGDDRVYVPINDVFDLIDNYISKEKENEI